MYYFAKNISYVYIDLFKFPQILGTREALAEQFKRILVQQYTITYLIL
jgi:hypothetical protein